MNSNSHILRLKDLEKELFTPETKKIDQLLRAIEDLKEGRSTAKIEYELTGDADYAFKHTNIKIFLFGLHNISHTQKELTH